MGWALAWSLGGVAWGGSVRAEKICDDIFAQYGHAQSSVSDVERYIAKDPRTYEKDVSACLCRWGAHADIQAAARRHTARDGMTPASDGFEIATGDTLSAPSTQVATLFARRLEQQLGDAGSFVLHPTWAAPPRWFDLYGFQTVLGSIEAPGSQPFSALAWERWVYTGEEPPRGRLTELDARGTLESRTDLQTMAATYDQVIWLDLDADLRDGDLHLTWVAQDIEAAPPHKTVGRGLLSFTPRPGPWIGSCAQPGLMAAKARPKQRRWPIPRRVTLATGTGAAAASLAFSLASFVQYRTFESTIRKDARAWATMNEIERAKVRRLARENIGFGIAAGAAGAVATVSIALPGRYWR